MTALTLRAWQGQLLEELRAHDHPDFLVVACPAAGKTIAATAAALDLMAEHDLDQLIVVAPTVVVRDQWVSVLRDAGLRMARGETAWQPWQHGTCTTYMQVGTGTPAFARACANRRTLVICDEIHHAGQLRSWGVALEEAFGAAQRRLLLSGTPFRSDRDRIPFVAYDDDGECAPDFTYDYPTAVRDGVCRAVTFRAHDGLIAWGEDEESRFSDGMTDRAQRLRASLDPDQPYLRSLLEHAHRDLLQLRTRVPDTAGLVVCDTQAHALAVDQLITEVTGHLPVLAISDIPHAHEAIAAFADDDEQWLVSVRMVAEGVDLPRLGVIAWATTASTELMVRQVTGRALRGRGDHARLPAIVHIPADPLLLRHAGRLDRLGGLALRGSSGGRAAAPRSSVVAGARRLRSIDPAPFLAWFDGQVAGTSTSDVLVRCGWENRDTATRALHRWRTGEWPHVLTIFDACHMAGISFDALYEGNAYAAQREYVHGVGSVGDISQRARLAEPSGAIADTGPRLPPEGSRPRPPRQVQLSVPDVGPSPEEQAAAERRHTDERAEVFRLLGLLVQLRRQDQPGYQMAGAHRELVRAIGGPVAADADPEHVALALDWLRSTVADAAAQDPGAVLEMARTQRRLRVA